MHHQENKSAINKINLPNLINYIHDLTIQFFINKSILLMNYNGG